MRNWWDTEVWIPEKSKTWWTDEFLLGLLAELRVSRYYSKGTTSPKTDPGIRWGLTTGNLELTAQLSGNSTSRILFQVTWWTQQVRVSLPNNRVGVCLLQSVRLVCLLRVSQLLSVWPTVLTAYATMGQEGSCASGQFQGLPETPELFISWN